MHARFRNSPDAFWMPFTPARAFREKPRMFVGARGMHYVTDDGREVLDAIAGLWCVNAGHGRERIVEAIRRQAGELDFVSSFTMSHPAAFELAERLATLAPGALNHVFFSNSGSEAVDTALKIARGYHRARGEGGRSRFIGRAKSYHGVGFGGVSVGGIARHKRDFVPLLPEVDHLPLPYDGTVAAFTRGPVVEGGEQMADAILDIFMVHDPSTIAAVIVEPVTGSGGVYPPPLKYLQRLREHCTKHGILLIFDEVITGFGRMGTTFAAEAFGVEPDILTSAKGLTNGSVPMGATIAADHVYDAFMARPTDQIELPHGYTYSAHPLACAAALATLEVYREDDLFARSRESAHGWAEALHGLRGAAHVIDVRNAGLLGAVELAPRPNAPGARGGALNQACFDAGVLIRTAGDTVLLSPPLIITPDQMAQVASALRTGLGAIA